MTTSAAVWAFSSSLFLAGLACIMVRRQLLAMLLGLELMINAANVNFAYYAAQWQDARGLALVLLIIAIAGAEAVVGLSFIVALSRRGAGADSDEIRELAG